MAAGVFSAFTVEAYMNHLGQNQVAGWGILERKLSPREKLDFLSTALHFTVDWSRRPYQSFDVMLKLRDALAHGKTEPIERAKKTAMGLPRFRGHIDYAAGWNSCVNILSCSAGVR